MVKENTKLVSLPYTDAHATQWYQVYLQSIEKIDLSLFSHRENNGIKIVGGGNITYSAVSGVLAWDNVIHILRPFSGLKNEIPDGNIIIREEEYAYITVKRNLLDNGGVIQPDNIIISKTIKNDDFFLLLFYVTENGEIITDLDNSITVTPTTINKIRFANSVNVGDFPYNPYIINNGDIDVLEVGDKSNKKNKKIKFSFTAEDTVQEDTEYWLGFDYLTGVGGDFEFDIDISKIKVGDAVSQVVFNNHISVIPVSGVLTRFIDDAHKFLVSPKEKVTVEITFKNEDIFQLGYNSSVLIYNFIIFS